MEKSFKIKELMSLTGFKTALPFILITSCFALWGFANDINGPIVQGFSRIFNLNVTESVLVQAVAYLGYFVMAIPAAIFIQKYSFKAGVLMGLGLFALGALLFIPARYVGMYYPFLLAYFILTCGISFMETSCNPYIYCMGSEETGILRLNIAQAFNPIGALLGMYITMKLVLARMSPLTQEARQSLTKNQAEYIKDQDLSLIIQPYILLVIIAVILLFVIFKTNMPKDGVDTHKGQSFMGTASELMRMGNYREGLVAMFFYNAAQVGCWTFILQYGTRVFLQEGMSIGDAELTAQKYNIIAMAFFAVSRFVCVWLLQYVKPGRLMAIMAIMAAVFVGGAILFPNRNGMYCLVAVSACMSMMFPTIYGIALRGVGDRVKVAGAGLIMSILGGSLLPPIQAMLIDTNSSILGVSSANYSFIIPLIAFIIIAIYGHRAYVRYHILRQDTVQ